jgi:hypothetical protein
MPEIGYPVYRSLFYQREQLIKKYVPEDERAELEKAKQSKVDDDHGQVGQDGQDTQGGSPPEPSRLVTLDEKVTTIRNLVSKRPTTLEDIRRYLTEGHYLAALKLKENGELVPRPDGTLEARP